jgi:hypothetical protein
MEASTSSGDDAQQTKKKKWYSMDFKKDWLQDEKLKPWLKCDDRADSVPECIVCKFQFINKPNKSALIKHSESEKHKKNFQDSHTSLDLGKYFKKAEEVSEDQKVARAELKLVGFMAEHRTPFKQADHLTTLVGSVCCDSAIGKKLKMKRTKAAYIMEGIAFVEQQRLADLLKTKQFSLLIDESTDISVSQILAIVVRYHDDNEVVDALLAIMEVDDGSAQGLYDKVKAVLKENAIPMNNLIGFGADNCATMMGKHSGFQALLRRDVPNVFVSGCICHSFALCSNAASRKLPSWLEGLLKEISSYFSKSAKRTRDFKLIQDVLSVENHKILKLSQTRWLSRCCVIARILEQWEPLTLFFQSEMTLNQEKSDKDKASTIYKSMKNAGTEHMLLFLNYVLPKVDAMNKEFQSEGLKIHKVFRTVRDGYRTLLSMFIQNAVIDSMDVAEIDPANIALHRPLSNLFLGGRCTAKLRNEPLGDNEDRFRRDCQSFLVELTQQIRERFDLKSGSVLDLINVIDPKVAMNSQTRPTSLTNLALHFPQLAPDLDKLDDEWQEMILCNDQLKSVNMESRPAEQFWPGLRDMESASGEKKFVCLGSFMVGMMSLPHSSACVERVFSEANGLKTKYTNSMHVATLSTRMLARQHVTRHGSCITWEPEKELVKDVRDGRCHQRYLTKLKENKADEVATLYDIYDD